MVIFVLLKVPEGDQNNLEHDYDVAGHWVCMIVFSDNFATDHCPLRLRWRVAPIPYFYVGTEYGADFTYELEDTGGFILFNRTSPFMLAAYPGGPKCTAICHHIPEFPLSTSISTPL